MEITTVIPVYNGERFLQSTLECLAAQTRRPDRVVVIDNQSTDNTPELVRQFRGIRCELIRNPTNIGMVGNLNKCLDFGSETRFLHVLTADDLVAPDFFAKVVPPLAEVSGRAMAYSLNDTIDQHGNVVGPLVRRPSGPPRRLTRNEFLVRHSEMQTIPLPGAVLKTDRQPPACYFENLPQVGDVLFFAEWATHSQAIIEIPEYLCHYRFHPFNASSQQMYDAQCSIRDEWHVMQRILPWFEEGRLPNTLRGARIACIMAARIQVKMDIMARLRPEKLAEFNQVRREILGPLASLAGTSVVRARDLLRRLRGQPSRVDELIKSLVTG
jgi:glycosyltransferase involved in cell wall biosynthesis